MPLAYCLLPVFTRKFILHDYLSLTGTGAGPALDNVSVVEVSSQPSSIPEPSSILGILSLGVLGIGAALKRKL